MLRLIKFAALAVVLLALAGLAFVFFAPAERFRDTIVNAVASETGRTVTIAGGMSFDLTPAPSLMLKDVTLPGADGAPLVHADKVSLTIEFFPLLTGDLRVNRIALDTCTITLSRSKDGEANWQADGQRPLGVGDLLLKGCKVAWRDDQAGRAVEIDATDLRLRWPQDASALSIAGEFGLRGERFEIDSSIGSPASLLAGGRSPVRAEIDGALLKGAVDGDADLQALRFEGGINISAVSARRLAQLFGITLPGDRGLNRVSMAASARILPGEAHFRDAKFTLDGMTGSGVLGFMIEDGVPDFTGSLNVDRFDLSSYVSLQEPESEDDESGWGTAAFDLADARSVAIDLGVKAKRAVIFGIAVQDADLSLAAAKGTVGLSLNKGTLNGGTAQLDMSADTTQSPVRIAFSASLANADAGTVLPDIAEIETVTGRLMLKLDVQGSGNSQRALMENLTGTADITLRDGSIGGIDLEAAANGISANEGFSGIGEDAATNFALLSAHFDIAAGVAQTSDLEMNGPFLRVDGRGSIGLPGRLLQILLSPRNVGDVYGKDDENHPHGLGVPFVITGAFAAPIFIPNAAELVGRLGKGEIAADELGTIAAPVHEWIVSAATARAAVTGPMAVPGVGGF